MNDERARQALSHWLNARIGHWRELEHRLDASTGAPGAEAENARKLVVGFRALIGDLAMARKHLPNSPISRYLESLFIRAHEVVYRPPKRYRQRLQDLYCREIPMLMHDMQAALVFTLQVFLLSIAVGWLLVFHNPELVALFASSEMINHVESGRLWTDDMLNIMPSSILSFGIIANNATVSLFAFALGALYGLGTLYVIVLNGVMLGGIFAFTARYDLAEALFEFIIAHGVVELSVIVIAGAMGLRLGEALIRPGSFSRLEAFRTVTASAGKVMLAAVPFLIVAGLLEGFVSPDIRFGLTERLLAGISSGTLFWLIMLRGFPHKERSKTIDRFRETPSDHQTAERSRSRR